MIAMTESVGKDAATVTGKSLYVDVQQALDEQDYAESEEPPSPEHISEWADLAFNYASDSRQRASELTIRLVEAAEMIGLNRDYRQKNQPTNVLSFPCEPMMVETDNGIVSLASGDELDLDLALLGDIVICHSVIVNEANEQQKTIGNHYAHMVTHGVLHLLGYDHQEDSSAEQMESLEIEILAKSGIPNPYNSA